MMKKSVRVLYLLLSVCLLLSLSACMQEHGKNAFINHALSGTETFSFGTEAPGEGVQANGTVFVQSEGNEATATVIAHVKRGESHGEGVTFYVPKGWIVTKVMTDFPAEEELAQKTELANVVKTADAVSEWAYYVEIACDKNQTIPDGAEGDVLVEFAWNYKSVGPDAFELLAGVGAGYSSGTKANGVTSVLLEIPLKK